MRAGKGFAQLAPDLGEYIEPGQETAYWRSQVEEVVRYWSGRESSQEESPAAAKARALALLAKISGELDEVGASSRNPGSRG